MNLGRLAGIAVGVASLLAPATAGAVTITEFDANPGHVGKTPKHIVSGPEGNLWWTEAGSQFGIMRMSPSGERFPIIPAAEEPFDLVVAPSGWASWTTVGGYGSRSPGGTVTDHTSGYPGGAIILNPSNEIRYGRVESGNGVICSGTTDNTTAGLTCNGLVGAGQVTGLAATTQKLWAAFLSANKVVIFDAGFLSSKVVDLPTASGPAGIAIGPEGSAWVTMVQAGAIDRIAPDGARTRFPLAAGSEPQDIVLGPDGAFWILELGTEKIARMTTVGVVTDEYPVPSPEAELGSITAGPDGALWFTEGGPGKIARLVPDPPLGPGPGPTLPAPALLAASADTTAPSFLAPPFFAPSRFAVKGQAKARVSRTARKAFGGSNLKFTLSEAATVMATIVESAPGRKAGRKCVAPGKAKPGAVKCTRYVTKGSFGMTGKQGSNKTPFSGKLKGKALTPGAYRATLVARDGAGNTSQPRTAAFTVVP